MLAVQYLEDNRDLPPLAPDEVDRCLCAAFERLPIDCVILGWNVPDSVCDQCRRITERMSAQLFHWHPLLTGHYSSFIPRPEWRTIGLNGEPIMGFRDLPEFTFLCPNKPAVVEAALDHLLKAIYDRGYQGVFLDRIRFPSPSADPANLLGCYCQDCQQSAEADHIDLTVTKRHIERLMMTPQGVKEMVRVCIHKSNSEPTDPSLSALKDFLKFRIRSITRFIQEAANAIHARGLSVGLDCFSPSLTKMVGQGLSELDGCSDWIKVMIYGHTLGPAGLPYELRNLANWLISHGKCDEPGSLDLCSQITHLALPQSLLELEQNGIPPDGLADELCAARASGIRKLMAGVELVRKEGVTRLNEAQIEADIKTIHSAGVDGLVLSWDLRDIPLEWLDLVGSLWR